MIGADEYTILDRHGNVVAVRRSIEAHEEAKQSFAALGFVIDGNTLVNGQATRWSGPKIVASLS